VPGGSPVFARDCATVTRRFCVLGAEAQRMRGYGYTLDAPASHIATWEGSRKCL